MQRKERFLMKTYQTPEVQLQLVSCFDVIATSGFNLLNDYFCDGEGEDDRNVLSWWGETT